MNLCYLRMSAGMGIYDSDCTCMQTFRSGSTFWFLRSFKGGEVLVPRGLRCVESVGAESGVGLDECSSLV